MSKQIPSQRLPGQKENLIYRENPAGLINIDLIMPESD
jgi:hypothetical protein